MAICLSLLLVFIGATSAKKEGDFGIFRACTTNNSLRLKCFYAPCSGSPEFTCEFKTNGSLLTKLSNDDCKEFILPGHPVHYSQEVTRYTCILTRKKRREEKNITIDYSVVRGKDKIRPCLSTTESVLHRVPVLMLVVVVLPLWTVLITDHQTA